MGLSVIFNFHVFKVMLYYVQKRWDTVKHRSHPQHDVKTQA